MTQTLTRTQIDGYNKMVEASRGTRLHADLVLAREDITSNGGFRFFGLTSIRGGYKEYEGEKFYVKTIHGITYIYWEWRCDKMRWRIADYNTDAKKYFGLV